MIKILSFSIKSSMSRICKTVFVKSVIDPVEATNLYNSLFCDIEWEEGVRSVKGFTRMAKAINYGDVVEIDTIINKSLKSVTDKAYLIEGIYLNYYENGKSWTPSHTHPGTHQLVISLGATRTLQINKKDFIMENGDVVIFGGSAHGLPKDLNVTEGRISIATFMKPI